MQAYALLSSIPVTAHGKLGAAIDLLEKDVCDIGIVALRLVYLLDQNHWAQAPTFRCHRVMRLPVDSGSKHRAEQHIEVVVTDRSVLTSGTSFGVLSNQIWKVTDLHSKYALIKGDLGWKPLLTG